MPYYNKDPKGTIILTTTHVRNKVKGTFGDVDPLIRFLLREPKVGLRRPPFGGVSLILPRGSYPAPFLGYLGLWLGSAVLKSRRPKKGVGYEPLGRFSNPTTTQARNRCNVHILRALRSHELPKVCIVVDLLGHLWGSFNTKLG